jgi:hypothetical protein
MQQTGRDNRVWLGQPTHQGDSGVLAIAGE